MRKPIRWVFASDNHGDACDQASIAALKDFVKFFKPDVRIHGGDCFDLRALRKGGSEEEQAEALEADIEMGCDFLKWYKPQYFLLGNHDARLIDWINSYNPVRRRMASQVWENEILPAAGNAKIFQYCKRNGVFKLGTLAFVHGFTSGIYAAKRIAEIYGNCLSGHTHAIDAFSIAGLEPRIGRTCGALCKLDLSYNRAHLNTLRQSPGFAYGFSYPDGMHRVFQAQPIAGTWLYPTEFREYKHEA